MGIFVADRPGILNPIRRMDSNQPHEQAELARQCLLPQDGFKIEYVNGEFVKIYDKVNTVRTTTVDSTEGPDL